MGKYFCLFISISLFSGISTAARVDIDDQFRKQRQIFVKAENALKRRHTNNYHRYLKKIPDYPLVPYLLYRDLRYHLSKATNQKVRSFLERYPNMPKSDKLRVRWLKSLWKKKDYPAFLSFYKHGLSSKLQCYQLQIRIKNDTIDQATIDEINDLWLYHKSRPKACDPVFAYWAKTGHRTDDLVWQRTALAMAKGVPSIVRYLKDLLPAEERYLYDLWFELRTHPAHIVDKAKKAQRSPKESVVFAYAIRRFTWRNSQKALTAWQKIKNLREFSEPERTAIWKALTLNLADKVGQPTLDWLNELPGLELTGELRVLRIRHALATLKWRQVRVWLDNLPQQEAELNEWKYWQARSLAQPGEYSEAQEIYQQLAGLRDFYGFLAAAQLGTVGQIQHQPLKPNDAILNKARQLPMVQRAKEFYWSQIASQNYAL